MSVSNHMRENLHRAYLEFFETAERKRRWNIFDDIPWDRLDQGQSSETKAVCIETFCAEEMYLPDFSAKGMAVTREIFGMAWFHVNWSYEESKHGLALREYLLRSSLRTAEDIDTLWQTVTAGSWDLPFDSRREMVCYGALQEAATFLAYKAQRDRAAEAGDVTLEAIYTHLSRDEAAHAGFYRTVLEFEMEEDRAGTHLDLAHVLANFRMPGDGLIPDYRRRLVEGGGGISSRHFWQHAVLATLRAIGTTRGELRLAAAQAQAQVQPDPRPEILAS